MYRATDIAKYVIYFSSIKNRSVSNLKLQKILYFIQAEFLIRKGCRCFSDIIEAWDFGPVIPLVYKEFRIYGGADIPRREGVDLSFEEEVDRDIVDEISTICFDYTASELVAITHNQTPWISAYKKYCNNEITPESIKAFFS